MARKRISEYRTKTLLSQHLELPYSGISVTDIHAISEFDSTKKYVVKVDQGVKGRFKKGLVKLDQGASIVPSALLELSGKGYSQFLIEEQLTYDLSDERYISINRIREGFQVLYSQKGGVNVENKERPIESFILKTQTDMQDIIKKTSLPSNTLEKIVEAINKYHFSFLEINPFLIQNDQFLMLDAAAEVDDTASFFVKNAWTEDDFTEGSMKTKTPEEKNIEDLAANSQAAFTLTTLNPDGKLWMLLSGGGASIVLADEVHNQGHGKELANYGEYSGNPNADETYIYTKNLLSLLLKSRATEKVLIIAGGVANFTDVRVTFKGLIKALDEKKDELQEQQIKVFVRRGGPHQEEGLLLMKQFLDKNNLLGIVEGPEMILTEIVSQAITNYL